MDLGAKPSLYADAIQAGDAHLSLRKIGQHFEAVYPLEDWPRHLATLSLRVARMEEEIEAATARRRALERLAEMKAAAARARTRIEAAPGSPHRGSLTTSKRSRRWLWRQKRHSSGALTRGAPVDYAIALENCERRLHLSGADLANEQLLDLAPHSSRRRRPTTSGASSCRAGRTSRDSRRLSRRPAAQAWTS